jgi:hypothetical protein
MHLSCMLASFGGLFCGKGHTRSNHSPHGPGWYSLSWVVVVVEDMWVGGCAYASFIRLDAVFRQMRKPHSLKPRWDFFSDYLLTYFRPPPLPSFCVPPCSVASVVLGLESNVGEYFFRFDRNGIWTHTNGP